MPDSAGRLNRRHVEWTENICSDLPSFPFLLSRSPRAWVQRAKPAAFGTRGLPPWGRQRDSPQAAGRYL